MTPEQRELIVTTLRNSVVVQDDGGANILMGQPAFWNRCQLVAQNVEVIYVDGYAVACKWNSWQVAQMYPHHGLQIYQGYALSHIDGRWLEHCWLMAGNWLVETTGPFVLYYGAALNEEELAAFDAAAAQYQPEQHAQGQYWTTLGPGRFHRALNEAFQMGRKRNPLTGEIIEDLFA